ncbi:hypothetical protein O181_064578 [Austropuccinia psidii MF-1]|uniref:Uncharacterized protein n=1 Tax=Austropuccinia psidii MF-1 TaxID=1389203 RepID=A0A9Q3ETS5_9BASI|nr:hypothetical protein [Austropuccinia psidii MF-1]
MDFTPLYPHSSSSSSTVSPNGEYVLTSVGDRLVVRLTKSMQVIRSWKCEDDGLKTCSGSKESIKNGSGLCAGSQVHKPGAGSILRKGTVSNSIGSIQSLDPNTGISSFRPSDTPQGTVPNTDRRPAVLTSISFSPNSQFAVALLRQLNSAVVYVYSIESDQLAAEIKTGAEGVASGEKALRWSPSGNSLMVWSDWGLRVTIWNLSSPQPKPVQLHHPKHPPHVGCSFSPDQRYFALLCRQPGNFRDHVGVYDTQTWTCVSFFELSPELLDAANLCWSPCGRYLGIIESAIFDYRVEIWSPSGLKLGVFTPFDSTKSFKPLPHNDSNTTRSARSASQNSNRVLSGSNVNDSLKQKDSTQVADLEQDLDGYVGLGIRCCRWRPGGEYFALGGWDGKVRILNDLTWTSVCQISLNDYLAVKVLNEPRNWIERTRSQGIISFEVATASSLPVLLRPDYSKPNPTIGVRDMEWNSQGDYLACRNDALPTVVFVFSLRASATSIAPTDSTVSSSVPLRPRLTSVLNFITPVKSMRWHPTLSHLVIVCATSALYLWYPSHPGSTALDTSELGNYCEGIGIPARVAFNPVAVTWIQNGNGLLLTDKLAFCLAFAVPEGVDDRGEENSRMME